MNKSYKIYVYTSKESFYFAILFLQILFYKYKLTSPQYEIKAQESLKIYKAVITVSAPLAVPVFWWNAILKSNLIETKYPSRSPQGYWHILLQSTAWYTGVKQHQPRLLLGCVTVLVCQFLLIVLRMRL